jgi:hypothetical protein
MAAGEVLAKRAQGQGRRRHALLHGRGLALAEGPRHRPRSRDDPRGAALGLETCATLGMLCREQAQTLKDAGLDYYNHNLDTAPEFYGDIITPATTRTASTPWRTCATPA